MTVPQQEHRNACQLAAGEVESLPHPSLTSAAVGGQLAQGLPGVLAAGLAGIMKCLLASASSQPCYLLGLGDMASESAQEKSLWAGVVAQLVECLPKAGIKLRVSLLSCHKLAMVVHTCNPRT